MFIVVKHLLSGIEGMGPLDLFCQSDILLYRNGKGLAVLLFPWGGGVLNRSAASGVSSGDALASDRPTTNSVLTDCVLGRIG